MSERTTANTLAGAQCRANRPPLTADSRLRMVFISTMSAPLASSCFVMSWSSSRGTNGDSKRAEPPPDRRKRTVSSADSPRVSSSACAVAEKVSPSGTGWPASRTRREPTGPSAWPCLVMTMPALILSPRQSQAALPMDQPALPAETRISRPGPKLLPSSARRTASSGMTREMAERTIRSASARKF